jgi:LmbE family N-acetylglucosaminyl deacetylase
MDRRRFLGTSFIAASTGVDFHAHGDLMIERARSGKPHQGKVLAAIQPHADDLPIFAAGAIFKLMDEGYTGYLIRITNDDSAGPGGVAQTVSANERDNEEVARVFGMKGSFSLNYGNHVMDGISHPELKARLIFLIRLLKIETVFCYDPWGHYEENPDHYVTAACVEAACWMAGGDKDYPEHFAAGLKPQSVKEKYYFGRFQQRINRVVDVGPWVEKKIDVNLANVAQGPAGANGARLKATLAAKGMRLPLLDGDDNAANRNYIREFVLRRDRETGQQHGLSYAEAYHYIGPEPDIVDEYVKKNAVRL